jgi:predicted nucleotidyltransferase
MIHRLQNVFESFRSHEVKYLVIGGVAAILYGVPRATLDLDILIEASPENARRLLIAMEEGGLGTASLTTPEELLATEVTIFRDRVRVDVQTSTPGIEFRSAWERRQEMSFHGVRFFVASKEDLIASKEAAGRPRDLEDVRILRLRDAPNSH